MPTIPIKIKNVTLSKHHNYLEEGLEMVERFRPHGVDVSLTGSVEQFNRFLQDAPIISERLRTLNNIPHFRIINTRKVEIY